MHTTAFIITDVQLPDGHREPDDQMLYQAAHQAISYAKLGNRTSPETEFDTFSIGSRQRQYIQGEFRTNLEQFGSREYGAWPQLSTQVMSQQQPEPIAANHIPIDILRNCWNTTDRLIALALENPAAHGLVHHDHGLIYPDVLVTMNGVSAHSVSFPDHSDVFDLSPSDGDTDAKRYLPGQDAATAHHLACGPIRRLARAQFHIQYLNALRAQRHHIVIEADWNL